MKRIYHTWEKWECYPNGFYESKPLSGLSDDECTWLVYGMLTDHQEFAKGLSMVIDTWVHSCEHYLTNASMNRIAWLGQASWCALYGVPASMRDGWALLTEVERLAADAVALVYLNKWLQARGEESVDLKGAGTSTQINLY